MGDSAGLHVALSELRSVLAGDFKAVDETI
jgi:hypothetical protein